MPSITNSIARAPSSNPNIFWRTVRIVGPIFEASFEDNHIAIKAKKTIKGIGR